jgi:DNA-binding response OmpR family regulator
MAYKLIIADASPSVQKAVQLAFAGPDWEVVPFDNGLELTKVIFEVHPDGLLISLSLPGMDGYGVARFVRKEEEFRRTPLVFLRGSFEAVDAEKIAGLDYDEVVQKPFDSGKLAIRLKNLIEAKAEHAHFPESPIPTKEEAQAQPGPGGGSEAATAAVPADELERRLQAWLQRELVDVEREVEKRVRLQIMTELKRWFAEHYIGLPSREK